MVMARTDTERLDWLTHRRQNLFAGDNYSWMIFGPMREVEGDTPREAIDGAMDAEQNKGSNFYDPQI